MPKQLVYSPGDLAKLHTIPPWKARIALDSLGAARIPRVGRMRVLPDDMLGEFRAELKRRGWLVKGAD